MILGRRVVLASASPRRQELLRELVSDFDIVSADLDEDSLTVADPWVTAESLAQAKAEAVLRQCPESFVIGGDTVVALPNEDGSFQQLTKPTSVEDAEQMLTLLSGKTHFVITGVCLAWEQGVRVFSDTSRVTFREMSLEETRAYVATGEPMDKAGSYASQGGGKAFIEKLEGSLTNVIGLPLEKLQDALGDLKA